MKTSSSASTRTTPNTSIRRSIQFMKTRGQNKVIWGTNYPAVTHKEAIQIIRTELGLSEKVADKILHGNAARVYKL